MQSKYKPIPLLVTIGALLLLILNTDTAVAGAQDGMKICMQVIVPSLFPFFFITSYAIPMLTATTIPGFHWLCKQLHMPSGSEGLLILGLLGGYPVGAQAICNNFQAGNIQKDHAHRLMGFCSNAGPAFIFGVTGTLFSSAVVPWILWLIHIISALLTGFIIPQVESNHTTSVNHTKSTIMQAFRQSINITVSVCGWVILFKVLLSIIFCTVPIQHDSFKIIFSAIMELSGGFIGMLKISNLSLRFILCSTLLAFGGICVLMQTLSVTFACGTGLYLHGKLIQTLLSLLLSLTLVLLQNIHILPIGASVSIYLIAIACIILLRHMCEKKLWKLHCI